MKAISCLDRIVHKVRQVGKKSVTSRQGYVTKPDVLDIPRKPKVSKLGYLIKQYINDNYLTHLDKQIVKNLEKCSFEEFLSQAQKLIIKSYNIPESLAAPMQVLPEINKKAGMMYDFTDNLIFVKPKTLKVSRSFLFSAMKHEYKHQKQNFQVLRTEGLGEHAVQVYAKIKAECGAEVFIQEFSNISYQELIALKPKMGAVYDWIIDLQKAVACGPNAVNEFKNKIIENDYKVYAESLNKFRQNVIEEMGAIPANTKEALYAQKYYEGFINLYKNPFSIKANIKNLNETEAYGAQVISWYEYFLHKFF